MFEGAISWVRERDIDLLLTSELYGSEKFSSWFFEACGFYDVGFVSAKISVTDSYGETDVLVTGVLPNKQKIIILVEHKIGASLQFEQDVRYLKRQNSLKSNEGVFDSIAVLVAPQTYINSSNNSFEKSISFEAIISELDKSDNMKKGFFSEVLSFAISYQKSGYQKIIHDTTSDFWRKYYDLTANDFPSLRMLPPDKKPAGSSFCYFRQAINRKILNKKVVLVHKWTHGNADLQFASTDPQELYNIGKLDSDMFIVKAGKSSSIRISVPVLDIHLPFEEQIEAIKSGLEAIQTLLTFSKSL